jgi:uncharacterized integral membrane protein (TIGR00697 family)
MKSTDMQVKIEPLFYKRLMWTVVILVGLYVIAQAVADVAATKFVSLFGVFMPAGTIMFALTFTLRDFIHKRLGRDWARATILVAGGLNIFQALYLGFAGSLDSAPFMQYGDEWNLIFAIVPAITIGSIIAEVISELVDTEVYHWWKNRFDFPQWTRVVVSNFVAIPVDTLVFSLLAFVILPSFMGGDPMSLGDAVLRLASGQVIFKAVVAVLSAPLVYLIPDRLIWSEFVMVGGSYIDTEPNIHPRPDQ